MLAAESIMRHAPAVLLVLFMQLLAACASSAGLQPAIAGSIVKGSGVYHAERVAWAVGKPANEEGIKQVGQQSGSGLLRPIAPGQAVTRDYRPGRLNVYINASNVITQVNCG